MTDFDHNAIDELLHSRARLAIVAFWPEPKKRNSWRSGRQPR